jgi:hypothetical protein
MTNWQYFQGNVGKYLPRLSPQTPSLTTLNLLDEELKSWDTHIPIETVSVREKVSPISDFGYKEDDLVALHHGALVLLHRIVCHHATSIRCLKHTKSRIKLPENHLRNLSQATRSIAYYVDELSKFQLTTYVQINGLSILRPIILSNVLSGDEYGWIYPHFGPEYMRSLADKFDGHDSWASRAAEYTTIQNSPSHLPSPDTVSSQISGQPPEATNAFDTLFEIIDSGEDEFFSRHKLPRFEMCSF